MLIQFSCLKDDGANDDSIIFETNILPRVGDTILFDDALDESHPLYGSDYTVEQVIFQYQRHGDPKIQACLSLGVKTLPLENGSSVKFGITKL